MKLVRKAMALLKKHVMPFFLVLKSKREVRRAFSNPECPPVLIYQMGKVGSSTIYNSLKNANIRNAVLHLHRLSDLNRRKKIFRKLGVSPLIFYSGEFVMKAMHRYPQVPIKIITAVRDPVAVVISGIFQNPYFHDDSIKAADGGLDPQKVVEYLESELRKPSAFRYVYEWFDEELKAVFGIDVFASPFPQEIGYQVYSTDMTDVLLIRAEDLSEKGSEAISSFLNLPDYITILNSNVRSDSGDKDKYQEVMKRIHLSRDLCNEIYSSSFVRHFYSDAMIDKLISKWTKE